QPFNLNSPAQDNIECVTADKAGYIWFSPHAAGLDRLDPATGVITHFQHNSTEPGSLASNTVSAILQDHEGTIWIGTYGGLDKFDSESNTFLHYRNIANDPSSLSCNLIRALYEDREGTLWI